jgi:adenosine deaminase
MKIQPKTDLHRHLDGSLRASTIQELGKKFNVTIPNDFVFKPHMTLDTALEFFNISLLLLQEKSELIKVASEICEDAEQEGLERLEIRFGPQLHQQKGLVLEEIIDSVLEGINGRAGLILCGLYGDDPKLLCEFMEIAKTRHGVVALDIAGAPHASQNFKLADYKEAYDMAYEYGIHRTVHASEGRDPQEIITAINILRAERLGHATTLLESPEALELVLEKNITIESCPTSNLQCGVVASLEQHPLGKWLKLGVNACINTDNTYFSQVQSLEEHQRALSIEGMDLELINRAIKNGLNSIFIR